MFTRLFKDKRAHSMTFWAVFIGFVMIPIMALGIELGRFFFSRSQIAAAADAAALASAVEINERSFVQTGQVQLVSSRTYSWAQRAVNANCDQLINLGVNPSVNSVSIEGNTVMVSVSANLSRLFPSVIPDITVTEWGRAEVRALRR